MSEKEKDFFCAERKAQSLLITLEQSSQSQLDFERALLLRTLLRDVFDKIQSGALQTQDEIDNYVRAVEREFSARFTAVGREFEQRMESLALARQDFYIKHQTPLDLTRDIDKLQAVQRRFFVDFRSVPKNLSERLRRKIVELIDKQNLVGVNEKETAKAIQEIANISFNKAYFIATQSQSLYLGWQRYYQLKAVGVTTFKYRGTIKKTTRDFCRYALGYPSAIGARSNNVWTLKEIEKWEKKSWKGKIEGVPLLVQAGGYRCRHAFIPVF